MRSPRSPSRNGGLLIKRGREEEGLLLRARTEEREGMRQGRKGRKREFPPKVNVSGIKTGCSGSRLTSGMVRSRTIAVYRQSYRTVTIVTEQCAGRRQPAVAGAGCALSEVTRRSSVIFHAYLLAEILLQCTLRAAARAARAAHPRRCKTTTVAPCRAPGYRRRSPDFYLSRRRASMSDKSPGAPCPQIR